MAGIGDLFSADKDIIELPDLNTLLLLCRYNPRDSSKFIEGLMLAEDLKNDQDIILYTTGTLITEDRIQRLLRLSESYPNMVLKFKLKRSEKLINSFRQMVMKDVKNLFGKKKDVKLYNQLFSNLEDTLNDFLTEILDDENILLTLYKMRLSTESASTKSASLFYIHSINTALFSVGIANSPELKSKLNFSKQEYTDLIKIALFHNYGGLSQIEEILGFSEKEQLQKYLEANRNGSHLLGSLNLNFEVMDALRLVIEYNFGRKDFIERDDKISNYANIIVVTELYSRMGSGLFGDRQKPTYVVDKLNVKAFQKEISSDIVKVLTTGLNMQDIFDFYMEMEKLVKACQYGFATPYPMTGFKSPTIFICKEFKSDCKYLEHSVKAVALLKPMGGLKEGKYSRCLLSTPKLLEFYKSHYGDIKEAASDKPRK